MTKTGQPRSESQKERDLRREADMYFRGKSQQEICAELELSPATVSRDLKSLQQEWRESRLYDMNAAKNKELARIDALERTYWEGWEKSLQMAHSTSEGISGPGSTVTLNSEREQFGDPRFLNGVMSCIEKRCAILGLNAPKEVVPGGPGQLTWAQFIGANITINNNNSSPQELFAGAQQNNSVIDVVPTNVDQPQP